MVALCCSSFHVIVPEAKRCSLQHHLLSDNTQILETKLLPHCLLCSSCFNCSRWSSILKIHWRSTSTGHSPRLSPPHLPVCSPNAPAKRWVLKVSLLVILSLKVSRVAVKLCSFVNFTLTHRTTHVRKMKTAGLLLVAGLCAFSGTSSLKICAFNVQSFGESKANNKRVMGVLLKVLCWELKTNYMS